MSHSAALQIPEIFKEVKLMSDRTECAVAARVSRAWSPVALDVLWRELDSIYPVLELISPLKLNGYKELVCFAIRNKFMALLLTTLFLT